MKTACPGTGSDVCAIVTTYRPVSALVENVRRVSVQVGRVVIVDDSGEPEVFERLKMWFGDMHGVIIVRQEFNSGVAAALNRGIDIARNSGYNWFLTLDDDTSVEPDLVSSLIGEWKALFNEGGKPVAIMGMSHRDSHTGCMDPYPAGGVRFVEKRGIITSGSLLSQDSYDSIGPFREEFFIDSVDYDFCLKARAKGYRVVKICKFGMTHSLGAQTQRGFGPFSIEITNHSPVRRYYMYRNSMVLAREYCLRDPLYSAAVLWFNLKTFIYVFLFEKGRLHKAKMMLCGVMDACRYHMGKCPW